MRRRAGISGPAPRDDDGGERLTRADKGGDVGHSETAGGSAGSRSTVELGRHGIEYVYLECVGAASLEKMAERNSKI